MVGVLLAVLVVMGTVGELVGLIGGIEVAVGLFVGLGVCVPVGRRVLVDVGGAVGTVWPGF